MLAQGQCMLTALNHSILVYIWKFVSGLHTSYRMSLFYEGFFPSILSVSWLNLFNPLVWKVFNEGNSSLWPCQSFLHCSDWPLLNPNCCVDTSTFSLKPSWSQNVICFLHWHLKTSTARCDLDRAWNSGGGCLSRYMSWYRIYWGNKTDALLASGNYTVWTICWNWSRWMMVALFLKYLFSLCLSCSQANEVLMMMVPKHHIETIQLPIKMSPTYRQRNSEKFLHPPGTLGTCWCSQTQCRERETHRSVWYLQSRDTRHAAVRCGQQIEGCRKTTGFEHHMPCFQHSDHFNRGQQNAKADNIAWNEFVK